MQLKGQIPQNQRLFRKNISFPHLINSYVEVVKKIKDKHNDFFGELWIGDKLKADFVTTVSVNYHTGRETSPHSVFLKVHAKSGQAKPQAWTKTQTQLRPSKTKWTMEPTTKTPKKPSKKQTSKTKTPMQTTRKQRSRNRKRNLSD